MSGRVFDNAAFDRDSAAPDQTFHQTSHKLQMQPAQLKPFQVAGQHNGLPRRAAVSEGAGLRESTQELFETSEAQIRYRAYSRLQAAAVAMGESLAIPEIVAIGGQSDGKSSLLEAFLGFRFNVREVEMGTRRPLIVQMVHDPTAQEPRCRLQEEDSDEYGPPIVPETSVADAIQRRTEEHLRKMGNIAVSSKPIVMRAEYAYCPNLTIIDTPGFILKAKSGELDNTPDEIMSMVKAQASPPHRMILFLQQSSVEWASSLWLRVVQEVDPYFQRTVIVASKFDNRLKEFAERWEVDKYLSATGYLPPNVRPFFVALPKDRAIQSSAEWRRSMAEVDAAIFKHLREGIKGGFDEERFASRIGFTNLKKFLEEELSRRYREAAPATLALLQERCDAVSAELMAAEIRLKAAEDVGALRRAAMKYADTVARQVVMMLQGSAEPDPIQHGLTTDEERATSRAPQWPGISAPVQPFHHESKLFGGAAFERCLEEFHMAVNSTRFPSSMSSDRLRNIMYAYKGKHHTGGPTKAAEDIARQAAKEALGPLLDAACIRLSFILRRLYDIAADRAAATMGSKENLHPYIAFHAALRSSHQAFINRLEEQARGMLRTHLEAATSQFAMNMYIHVPDPGDADELADCSDGDVAEECMVAGERLDDSAEVLNERLKAVHLAPAAGKTLAIGPGRFEDNTPSRRATKSRRVGLQQNSERPLIAGQAPGNGVSAGGSSVGSSADDVISAAESLFRKIRCAVATQYAPATLKSTFLDPMSDRLALEVSLDLFARNDADFGSMFSAAGAVAALAAKRDMLARRVEGLIKCKNEFQELAKCL
ncbi:dynamin-related GTPase [Volvox carteri f. nagariensis]|uniref:Dynamin-related GTPase n=1 Tax=Volvox carteri f. nagariensis TaxID=3068 RepID=D8U4F7_VOLCA|nr:dynamin-related GTPase [Volvox carteri f. nagariensis]EFJ45494.1 dynamin-related GTPase [Volvox carteri f. nagariensis]|eukprot:XP_002953521.1 dynamin-related GTPase [Volvox carteri f. nagariensis]